MNFEEWKQEVDQICKTELGYICFTEEDDFDVNQLAEEAFEDEVDPESFFYEIFGEDVARRDYDRQLAEEALEYLEDY